MRCRSCDVILSESELTLKDNRGEFTDLCYTCNSHSIAASLDAYDNVDDSDSTEKDLTGIILQNEFLDFE
jgi:hypothetical protein